MNSYWLETKSLPHFSSLSENLTCDVCIIGGGITGITLSYLLTKAGKKVILLEKDKLASSTSGHTTAKITSQHGLFYSYLIDTFGLDYAKSYLEANENAIQNIFQITQEENIDCDFEWENSYVFTEQLKEVDKIKQEYEAMQKLDFPASFLTSSPLPIEIQAGISFPHQAQFHVRKYLAGLIDSILKNTGILYEDSLVTDVQKEGSEYITTCNDYRIQSKFVVISTKYPFINIPGFYFAKMYQSMSYAIAVETQSPLFDGMYINSEIPTMSFRTIKDGEKKLLLIGGSDHKTGSKIDLSNAYSSLEDIAKKMYPDAKTKYRWCTEDCISLDKIPYVGAYSNLLPNVYVATGFKKWGMTTSNVAAHILTDSILQKENIYKNLFLSTRFSPIQNAKELGNMMKETVYSLGINKLRPTNESINTNSLIVTIQDDNEKRKISFSEFRDSFPCGEGRIVEIDEKKVGIYKDENNTFFAIKPICSHLGCELSFNNLAKSWDCPCHGSRFDYHGNCLYGPSVEGLPVIDISYFYSDK